MKKEFSALYINKRGVIAKLCIFMFMVASMTSTIVIAAPPGTGFTLSFEENFDGNSLNTGEWSYRTGAKLDGYNRSQNVSVSGGYLNIALKNEVYGGKNYTCGGVISKRVFQYGYYETRAKLTSLPGWHNSFWLLGDSSQGVQMVNEIDGFECDSHNPSSFATNTHYYIPSHVDNGAKAYTGINTATDYHIYGWEWTPTAVYFYLDGTLIRTVKYNKGNLAQNVWITGLAWDVGYGIQGNTSISYDYFRYYSKTYPEEILIDNGESGYSESGVWSTSGLTGFADTDTRYSSNVVGSYANWTPTITSAGTYRIYLYKIFNTNNDSNAKIDVVHSGGTTTQYINYATGSSGWVDLGTFNFNAGTSGYVRNTLNTAYKNVRSDAIRFVKQ